MRFLELLRKEFLHLKKDWGVLIILFLKLLKIRFSRDHPAHGPTQ